MAKPFTLTQLRYFAVVAELENMTAAAERLLVTQSTLSTAMAQLEASLSTQLFVRLRTRGLRLTPSGRQLAQDIESDAAAAWRVVLGSTDDPELRGFALTGLSDAAVRLAMWKRVVGAIPSTVPFAGTG